MRNKETILHKRQIECIEANTIRQEKSIFWVNVDLGKVKKTIFVRGVDAMWPSDHNQLPLPIKCHILTEQKINAFVFFLSNNIKNFSWFV